MATGWTPRAPFSDRGFVVLSASISAWRGCSEQSVSIVKRYKLVACTSCDDYRCLLHLRILIHLVVYRLPVPFDSSSANAPTTGRGSPSSVDSKLRGSCRALPCVRVRDSSSLRCRCWVRAPRHMYVQVLGLCAQEVYKSLRCIPV